ncbi:UDP-N-acetylglucosamine diphosphorylase [Spironucleus salmonicida]|uniref:UDP-N-acetylglucosamine diphosphorylase n=1 Tax=Spironucleus salmonicida TaxID=348837 RepID=V6LC17_9EUKA|nr:UDP-N-acetylglucosamine diphosphorylase [Spironucleus salmonicida]|eukprot:EST41773.1 UDP-N-acetylglucosamine diphosphorylase [Spironucleus salmonicida]
MLKVHQLINNLNAFKIQFPIFEDSHYPHEFLIQISNHFINNQSFISPSAKISPLACIEHPVYIGDNVEIRAFAYVRGNAIILKNSIIGQSVEIKNSILFENVQVPHLSYIGDSILGNYAHLGAGAVISNVRLDKKTIRVQGIDTGLQKFGALLGDGAQIGCNSVINPGSILMKNSYIIPCTNFSGLLQEGENNKYK